MAPILPPAFLWWVKMTKLDKYPFNSPAILIAARGNKNIPTMYSLPFLYIPASCPASSYNFSLVIRELFYLSGMPTQSCKQDFTNILVNSGSGREKAFAKGSSDRQDSQAWE